MEPSLGLTEAWLWDIVLSNKDCLENFVYVKIWSFFISSTRRGKTTLMHGSNIKQGKVISWNWTSQEVLTYVNVNKKILQPFYL